MTEQLKGRLSGQSNLTGILSMPRGGSILPVWGQISGNIAHQLDLAEALNAKAGVNHRHDGLYSPLTHDHDDLYSLLGHTHDYSDRYAAIDHNHNSLYSLLNHTHDGLYALLDHTHDYSDTYAAKNHNHDSSYSAIGHTHDYSGIFAAKDHNHDTDYAAKNHNHNDLYSLLNHDHDTDYAAIDHTHDYSAVFAPITHNHNDLYSLLGHDHDSSYSAIGHDHDDDYAAIDHTHDYSSVFAAINHDHDSLYSLLGHTHDDRYYTETELDTLLGGKQNSLTFDSTPSANSSNPVTSAGIYAALIQSVRDLYVVTLPNVSNSKRTFSAPGITANHKMLVEGWAYFSNASAVGSSLTITTAANQITVSGTITGTTNIVVALAIFREITAT